VVQFWDIGPAGGEQRPDHRAEKSPGSEAPAFVGCVPTWSGPA